MKTTRRLQPWTFSASYWRDHRGSQREDDLAKLEERITELGMKPEDYDFYLDLRKYGSTRHAGFGLGFERMVMYATGIANIRDVIPYPRTVGKCQY